MSRYIDADLLLEKLKSTPRYFTVKFDIENAPTADVKPIVYAEWVIKKTKQRTNYKTAQTGHCYWLHEQYVCSNCGEIPLVERADDCADEVLSNYCPNCGAKMKGEEEE